MTSKTSPLSTGEQATKSASELLERYRDENPEDRVPVITSHQCDVSLPEDVNKTFEKILSEHDNKLDVLVTSAGFTEYVLIPAKVVFQAICSN